MTLLKFRRTVLGKAMKGCVSDEVEKMPTNSQISVYATLAIFFLAKYISANSEKKKLKEI